MNPDDLTVGSVTIGDSGDYGIVTANGIMPMTTGFTNGGVITSNISANTIKIATHFDIEDFLDQRIMNRVTADHKVQEQELMKLRETVPAYADEIKENLTKSVSRDIIKKMTFTKKHDKDADVHHFIGRVWVFTEDELKNLISEARNV